MPLPFRLGTVNCYLLASDAGYLLVDTGPARGRKRLLQELERSGCQPGTLRLIVLTHGDFDHTGNAAYLRNRFSTKVAMHRHDAGMAERGDMFWNRQSGNAVLRTVLPLLFGFGHANRFVPDLSIEEGYDLSEHGITARVLELPGHSKGSVGILTEGGDLFCGDLIENTTEPAIGAIMDDPTTAGDSAARLRALHVSVVYPGHGKPFPPSRLAEGS